MPRQSTFRARVVRSVIIAGILLLPVACGLGRAGIHPQFVDNFIEVNRRDRDDLAVTVAFDATNRILAVGRESGRLEIWDTRKENARRVLEAHSQRTEHIAFGNGDNIIFSSSEIDGRTKVWDVNSGELLHEIDAMGPVAASPVTGLYLVASSSGLMLYEHARRTLLTDPTKIDGVPESIAADAGSSLVAVGTASGSLQLLKLEKTDTTWKLSPLRQAQPYEVGDWIQAVALRDGGKSLVSVARSGAVVEWDAATLEQRRAFPCTLLHVGWASFTPNEPWLVLAGTMDKVGVGDGKVELVNLSQGTALRFKANSNMPTAVLLPEISLGLILTRTAKRIRYLDEPGNAT